MNTETDPRYVDEEEIEGKTIRKVVMEDHCIGLAFTDGTFTSIVYGGGYYVGEGEMMFDMPWKDTIEKLLEPKK